MPFPNPDTQFRPGESGNPTGKPKGTKHLATHIQDLLEDDTFQADNVNGKGYTGVPIKAIITVAIAKALDGDNKWADWLGKYGYGSKVDITSKGESIASQPDELLATQFSDFLKGKE